LLVFRPRTRSAICWLRTFSSSRSVIPFLRTSSTISFSAFSSCRRVPALAGLHAEVKHAAVLQRPEVAVGLQRELLVLDERPVEASAASRERGHHQVAGRGVLVDGRGAVPLDARSRPSRPLPSPGGARPSCSGLLGDDRVALAREALEAARSSASESSLISPGSRRRRRSRCSSAPSSACRSSAARRPAVLVDVAHPAQDRATCTGGPARTSTSRPRGPGRSGWSRSHSAALPLRRPARDRSCERPA
jgi:hypothetical protein